MAERFEDQSVNQERPAAEEEVTMFPGKLAQRHSPPPPHLHWEGPVFAVEANAQIVPERLYVQQADKRNLITDPDSATGELKGNWMHCMMLKGAVTLLQTRCALK